MAENKKSTIAREFTGLPLDGLIGAPLIAATKANNMMSVEQMRFLLKYCFYQKEGEDNYEPVMIRMTLSRTYVDPDGDKKDSLGIKTVSTKFELPLLTMIPITSLAVDSLDIKFNMEVKSQQSIDTSEEKNTTGTTKQNSKNNGFNPGSSPNKHNEVELIGSVSYDSNERTASTDSSHYESTSQASLSIEVKAKSLPLPKGITTILDAFTKSLNPVEVTNNKPEEEENQDSKQ